jgi:hypothetical protein
LKPFVVNYRELILTNSLLSLSGIGVRRLTVK